MTTKTSQNEVNERIVRHQSQADIAYRRMQGENSFSERTRLHGLWVAHLREVKILKSNQTAAYERGQVW